MLARKMSRVLIFGLRLLLRLSTGTRPLPAGVPEVTATLHSVFCLAVGRTSCPVCDIPEAVASQGCGILQGPSVWPAGEKSVCPVSPFAVPPGLSSARLLAPGSHCSLPKLCVSLGCVAQTLPNLWGSCPGRV